MKRNVTEDEHGNVVNPGDGGAEAFNRSELILTSIHMVLKNIRSKPTAIVVFTVLEGAVGAGSWF